MAFKMRNQGLPGINGGSKAKSGGRAPSAAFQQSDKKELTRGNVGDGVDYNSSFKPHSVSSVSPHATNRMYKSTDTTGLDSRLTYDDETGDFTRTEITSSPAFLQKKATSPVWMGTKYKKPPVLPSIPVRGPTIPSLHLKPNINPNTRHPKPTVKAGGSMIHFKLPRVLTFEQGDTGEKPSGLPQKDSSILYGTKETHNGVDTYKTLKEVRDNISNERQILIKHGATEQEVKNFDTYQNKRISELYKRGQ